MVDGLKVEQVSRVFVVYGSDDFIGTVGIPLFDVAGFSVNQLIGQGAGSAFIGAVTVLGTMVTLLVVDAVIGLRVSDAAEAEGLDPSEHGMHAYPEFTDDGGAERAVADGSGSPTVEPDGGVVEDDDPSELRPDGGTVATNETTADTSKVTDNE